MTRSDALSGYMPVSRPKSDGVKEYRPAAPLASTSESNDLDSGCNEIVSAMPDDANL